MCMCGCWSRIYMYMYFFYKEYLHVCFYKFYRYIVYLSHGAVLCVYMYMYVCNYIKFL